MSVCRLVYVSGAWFPWRSEKRIRFPATVLWMVVRQDVDVRDWTQVLWESKQGLLACELPPQPWDLLYLEYEYVCVSECGYVHMWAGVFKGQKSKWIRFLELEFQALWASYMGLGNNTQLLYQKSECSKVLSHLSSYRFVIFFRAYLFFKTFSCF